MPENLPVEVLLKLLDPKDDCRLCEGRGFYYGQKFARTCLCRFPITLKAKHQEV
jgi:hypothetical protein